MSARQYEPRQVPSTSPAAIDAVQSPVLQCVWYRDIFIHPSGVRPRTAIITSAIIRELFTKDPGGGRGFANLQHIHPIEREARELE